MATTPNNQAKAAMTGGMMVRKRMAATKNASSPMAPVMRGWVIITLPVRSICGCQNNESNIENAATITAQKKIQKTSANGLNRILKFGIGISGTLGVPGAVGGILPLGRTILGAALLMTSPAMAAPSACAN